MGMGQCRNLPFALGLEEYKGTVNKIAIFAQEFTVTSHLEIFPREIRILVFRSVRGNCIPDLVRGELLKKRFEINVPTIRFTELPSFKIIKLISRKLIDKFIRLVLPHDHRWKENRMERDVVLADEIDKSCLR